MKKVVAAIDSFKGCLRSVEANAAAAAGVRDVWPDAKVQEVTVSDGGEGFMEAWEAAIGGEIRSVQVHDPLMREVSAKYLLNGETAVIEVAEACGLWRLKPEERNPLVATSYGVGEMVADAVKNGAKTIIVGLGGSGTSDAGKGMVEGLGELRVKSEELRIIIATDVENPLCGEYGAAAVYGPQKGATAEMVKELDKRAKAFAEESAKRMGFDRSEEKGAGAAGGLGYAFMQYMHAERRSGIDLLLETIHFDNLTQDADLVITGEGAADRQTLMGKLPVGILRHSGKAPVCLIAGKISDREALLQARFAEAECINPPHLALEEAMRPDVAKQNIRNCVARIVSKRSEL
ncbi:MAG: glycerate kinase [Deltaproteobacteria bacterium]|nr:glycerate kinase [Deltaproteobacteria bacterium]